MRSIFYSESGHVEHPQREAEMALTRLELARRCLTQWTPPIVEEPLAGLTKVALIGMGFSANRRNDLYREPGLSNKQIAQVIATLWRCAIDSEIEVHVLLQREVAEAVLVLQALEPEFPRMPIHCWLTEKGEESHISSVEILEQAWNYGRRRGIADAVVAAQKAHSLRAQWIAQLWGFNVRSPHYHAWSYAPESTQRHTHNALYYLSWEIACRAKLVLFDYQRIGRQKEEFGPAGLRVI